MLYYLNSQKLKEAIGCWVVLKNGNKKMGAAKISHHSAMPEGKNSDEGTIYEMPNSVDLLIS